MSYGKKKKGKLVFRDGCKKRAKTTKTACDSFAVFSVNNVCVCVCVSLLCLCLCLCLRLCFCLCLCLCFIVVFVFVFVFCVTNNKICFSPSRKQQLYQQLLCHKHKRLYYSSIREIQLLLLLNFANARII